MDVLVVDDELVSRHIAAQTLEAAGYNVRRAVNGREALDILLGSSIELVICDWNMPEMDGLEVCRHLRSGTIERYIYMILLTGNDRPEDIIMGLQAGADEFLVKPFNPVELVLRVNIGRRIIEQESRAITVFALARLAESRDFETGGHLKRVSQYCRVLAEYLRFSNAFDGQLDADFVRMVAETSPLHDIGKVAIPDFILRKPGPLTVDEFAVMKTHTVQGAGALAETAAEFPNASFLQMAQEIALYHHEKFDGSGYPFGLAGEDIPLAARIVALADAYDAITSKRSYKEAIDPDRARSLIVSDSGAHFDPRVVNAFLAMEDEFRVIHESFPPAAISGGGLRSNQLLSV
ncbi:MAG TPA: two-component system response regulator [Planctomycetaceae bacterium]|nr:two-component system response regulator [Planctomycetaceae bacterium]